MLLLAILVQVRVPITALILLGSVWLIILILLLLPGGYPVALNK